MTISKNAWHFRYMGWLGFSKPTRLCPYFWKLVFCLMVPVVFTVLILAILGGLTWLGFQIIPPLAGWFVHNWMDIALGLGLVAFAISLVYGVFLLASWLSSTSTAQFRYYIAHSEPVRATGRGASITGSYIVAWHHKVCPFLTFTE